jgi:catechol 2,3-dioxygenase-like lactoylglutathione lyase family enzyme
VPFTIGKNFHIIHMTGDLKALDAWYYDVFSVQRFMPDSYMPAEVRDASLVLVGDLCVETLAPAFHVEGWDNMPLGRFYNRLGSRYHSLAWYVDEGFADLYTDLKAAGVRCYGTGGVTQDGATPQGAVFTHPRDTYTQLEFVPAPDPSTPRGRRDPRFKPGWSPEWWAEYHPLRLQRFSHTTIATNDVAKARDLYVDVLKGTLLYEGEMAATRSTSAFVLVGEDLVVELAQPLDDESIVAKDIERYHESLFAVTYQVADLAAAEAYLAGKGVGFVVNDGTTLISDPDTTQGCTMGFTTWTIPGDPRPSWAATTT